MFCNLASVILCLSVCACVYLCLCLCLFCIVQLYTYQRSFMTKFSMVRSRVDVELLASVQILREALSKAEVKEAKEKKDRLEDFHSVSCVFVCSCVCVCVCMCMCVCVCVNSKSLQLPSFR